MRPRIVKRSQRSIGMSVQQIEPINRTQLPGAINNVPQELPDGLVTYPLTVADGVKGGSSAVDPLSLDIAGLPAGTLATTTELAINNGALNEKTTLSDLATFLDGRDVYSVADITALNAITGMDEGDVAIVADTFDDTGENVSGSYIYNGTSWLLQSWYNVYLNTLLDVNAPSPVAGDILQWNGTQWINVANAFAPINGTPTEVRYFDNAGVDFSDPLFTRDSVTNHTEAVREYDSTQTINTFTSPVSFPTSQPNGTFTIGDQVETWLGEAQAEVLDTGTIITAEPSYTNLAYSGVGLNDLGSIDVGGYTGGYPVSYTIEVLQNNVAYSSTGPLFGTISIGDTITGLSSGATATVVAIDTFSQIIAVDTIVGTFIASEIVEGNTPSDFLFIGGDFSTVADIILLSNTNANSIITTIAPTSQLEGVETSFSSFTGHTIGDTWTFDISPTTTLTIVYLTNITGTLPLGINTRLNNLTTPFQTGDGNIITPQFTIGDSVDVIDLSGFTTIGNIQITGVSGDVFQYILNSGTISLGNYLYSGIQGKQGFVYDIDSSIVTSTINTGFRTEPILFPNVPFLEASALVSDNGTDKVSIGTFDLSPFGGSSMSSGIVGSFGDGSQSTFTMEKGIGNISVFDSVSNRSYNQNFQDSFSANGYDGTNSWSVYVGGSQFQVYYNNIYMNFPNNYGSNGDALLTDGGGNLYRGPATVTPVNGVTTLGSDIGLGGSLNQYTNILHSGYGFALDGIDSANNRSGLIVEPTVLNGIGAFSGAYTGLQSYNKSGVFSTGPNEYGAIMGTSDDTGSIPNASYTRHNYNFNTAVAVKHTRLVDINNDFSRYDDVISVGGGTVSRDISSYIGTPFSTGYGNGYTRTFDLDNGSDTEFLSNNFNNSVVQTSSVLGLGQYQIYVRDASGTNSNALIVSPTDIEISQYPRNRDDTTTTTPINFLYTNFGGKLQSAPLSTIVANKATQIGTDGLGALFTGTIFTLPQIPSFIHGVYVNTAYNHPIVDYTVVGTDITFNTTLSSDLVTVVYEYF